MVPDRGQAELSDLEFISKSSSRDKLYTLPFKKLLDNVKGVVVDFFKFFMNWVKGVLVSFESSKKSTGHP